MSSANWNCLSEEKALRNSTDEAGHGSVGVAVECTEVDRLRGAAGRAAPNGLHRAEKAIPVVGVPRLG
jgi:hypothetical protein